MINYQSPYNVLRMKVLRSCVSRMHLGNVAELGCGIGAVTPILLERADHVTSFDFEPAALETARNTGERVSFQLLDLNGSLPDTLAHTFDTAVALDVIEHLDSPGQFLDYVARCLRPEGTLLLSTPNMNSPEALVDRLYAWRHRETYTAWDSTHRTLFNVGGILKLLRSKSFKPLQIVGCYYDTDVLPLLRFRLRLPLKASSRWPLNRFGFNTMIVARLLTPAGEREP